MLTAQDRKMLGRWLTTHAVVGSLLLALVSAIIACAPPAFRAGHPGTQRTLSKLRGQLDQGAEVVLIGNSLLDRGVHVRALRDNLLAAGRRSALLVQDGAVSAFFYLAIKNTAAAGQSTPRLVLIFIMADELAAPSRKTGGSQESVIKAASSPREPVYMRIVLRDLVADGRMTEAFLAGMRYLWPAYSCKGNIQDGIFEGLTSLPGKLLARIDRFARWPDYRTARVMLDRERRPRTPAGHEALVAAEREEETQVRSFTKYVGVSFLPEIERLCANRNIRLGFVRLKPNPALAAARPRRQEAIERHMQELKAYCDAHGMLFLDVSKDPNLDQGCFSSDDHMAAAGRDHLTPLVERYILDRLNERRIPRDER
jgi:hypothetical protein